jgi:hypothetical protein
MTTTQRVTKPSRNRFPRFGMRMWVPSKASVIVERGFGGNILTMV